MITIKYLIPWTSYSNLISTEKIVPIKPAKKPKKDIGFLYLYDCRIKSSMKKIHNSIELCYLTFKQVYIFFLRNAIYLYI